MGSTRGPRKLRHRIQAFRAGMARRRPAQRNFGAKGDVFASQRSRRWAFPEGDLRQPAAPKRSRAATPDAYINSAASDAAFEIETPLFPKASKRDQTAH